MKKMSSKYIKLQRRYNSKNMTILQKLPSTKHKTHRTYDSLGNTFLGFYSGINVTLLKTDVSVILQQTLGSLNTWET